MGFGDGHRPEWLLKATGQINGGQIYGCVLPQQQYEYQLPGSNALSPAYGISRSSWWKQLEGNKILN